jgi:hypothetical protein
LFECAPLTCSVTRFIESKGKLVLQHGIPRRSGNCLTVEGNWAAS